MNLFGRIKSELNKITMLRSLRFRLGLILMLVGLFCCLIMRFGIMQSYFNRALEVRTLDVQNQIKILADHLITYDYLQDQRSEVVNAELNMLSNLYDGRVLIINNSFNVIKDTYNVSQGKTIISEEVIRCFKGESITNYDDNNNYIEMTVPITMTVDEEQRVVGVILTSVSADSIVNNQEILDRQAVLIAIVILIIVFGIAVAVPREIMKPFDKVTSAINEVKAGFTSDKIVAEDYTELEHIADAFNQLMARMKVLDDSRQEFVSNVSHELKTPLTSVKVLADSLNTQEDVPVELYKEFMSDIVNEIDRENKIINDLLSLVKLDKTASELNIESVDINKLMESIFKRLMPLAKEQGIDLIFESQRQVVAEVDEVKLSLAITNLIENGIKYNREEGWVKVTLDADHQFFTFEVADSGLGIDEESQKHIFERFYRVDKSHSREIGGTGLGLAITRSTILMHRGSIKVSSVPEEGTVFTVKVPLSYIQ
ncbi:MAG: HAMP domain-containing histidine kinase [Lachnospiraceae bacterium]|nr:HAMP domain-containing histidine kinase [Lachnospiraceae bacterium]